VIEPSEELFYRLHLALEHLRPILQEEKLLVSDLLMRLDEEEEFLCCLLRLHLPQNGCSSLQDLRLLEQMRNEEEFWRIRE
jgi:hypothetical protein